MAGYNFSSKQREDFDYPPQNGRKNIDISKSHFSKLILYRLALKEQIYIMNVIKMAEHHSDNRERMFYK